MTRFWYEGQFKTSACRLSTEIDAVDERMALAALQVEGWCDLQLLGSTQIVFFADLDEQERHANEIERLMEKAETGEQWAHIAKLEAEYVGLYGEQVRFPS